MSAYVGSAYRDKNKKVSTLNEGIFNILKEIGYINHRFECDNEKNPTWVSFLVTPKEENGEPFTIYIYPTDSISYYIYG